MQETAFTKALRPSIPPERTPHSRIMKDEKSHLESKATAGIDNDALEGGGVTLCHIQSS